MIGNETALGIVLTQVVTNWIGMILLVHLVIWISLKMARGAMPVGFVLYYVLNAVLTMLIYALAAGFSVGGGGRFLSNLMYAPLAVAALSVVLILVLHRVSLLRLEALAAES